jgi:hypothetical protein
MAGETSGKRIREDPAPGRCLFALNSNPQLTNKGLGVDDGIYVGVWMDRKEYSVGTWFK